MYTAFSCSDYYASSVASRARALSAILHSSAVRRASPAAGAPFVSLNDALVIAHHARASVVAQLHDVSWWPRALGVVSGECGITPLETGVQAMAAFTIPGGSCGTEPSTPSGCFRFDGMLLSPLAFAAR